MIFAFLDGSCPKFKIVLQKRYVAQHLQNWVLILTIFSESNPKQYLRLLRDKNVKREMISRIFAFLEKT